MLFKLDDNQAINTDYIINVFVRKPELKWLVLGKMIDSTMLILSEHISEETALAAYDRLVLLHNERSKVLPADIVPKHSDRGLGSLNPWP